MRLLLILSVKETLRVVIMEMVEMVERTLVAFQLEVVAVAILVTVQMVY